MDFREKGNQQNKQVVAESRKTEVLRNALQRGSRERATRGQRRGAGIEDRSERTDRQVNYDPVGLGGVGDLSGLWASHNACGSGTRRSIEHLHVWRPGARRGTVIGWRWRDGLGHRPEFSGPEFATPLTYFRFMRGVVQTLKKWFFITKCIQPTKGKRSTT